MAIVPIYRLRADHSENAVERRYRFSRDPAPDPNPRPGNEDDDAETKWIVDGVAFYAWSDQLVDGKPSRDLRPVYEFHLANRKRHQYYYSIGEDAPPGFKRRPYVAFWAYERDVVVGAPAVHRFLQDDARHPNYALSVEASVRGWTPEKEPAFYASERVPVQVSVRSVGPSGKRYDWTFEPSTVNLAYGSTLEFVRAPSSDFVFTGLEILAGDGDFEPPTVSDDRVQVKALCDSRGRDYKYNVKVRIGSDGSEIIGDPEIVNQDPPDL